MSTSSIPAEQQALEKIERLARPLADELGLVFYDIEMAGAGRHRAVRVYLDRAGSGEPGTGVTVDELARVLRGVNASLEVDGEEFAYALEFSSPGIERELRTERQYALNVGRDVRIVCGATVDGRNVHEGRLVGIDAENVVLESKTGVVHIPREVIRRARTVYDFGRSDDAPSKGAAAKKNVKRAGDKASPARR